MKKLTNSSQTAQRYLAPEALVVELSVERGFNMSMPEIGEEKNQLPSLGGWNEWED